MTDKPVEQAAASQPETTAKQDNTLQARRILVWVLAVVLGGAVTAASFTFVPALWGKEPIPLDAVLLISFVNVPLLPLTALPVALLLLIWLDAFMGTKILPD